MFDIRENNFFFIVSYLNALQYDTLFSLTLFVIYFLHSTSVLSFYLDSSLDTFYIW